MSAYQQTNISFTGSLVVIIGPMLATAALFVLLPLMFSVVHTPSGPKEKPLEIPLLLKVIKKAPAEIEKTQEKTRPIEIKTQQQVQKTKEAPAIDPLIEVMSDNYSSTIPIVTENNLVKNAEVEFAVSQSPGPDIFTFYEVDRPPVVLQHFVPQYPSYAKENHIEGKVVLRFIVDKDGNVVDPVVTESEPEGVFDDAAIEAIRRYRFKPAEKYGKPVDCIVVAPIAFQLR